MTVDLSTGLALARTVLLLWACEAAVRWLPFSVVASRVLRVRRRGRVVPAVDLTALVESAAALGPPTPGCLARALSLGRLLLAHGHDARVVVGVSRTGGAFAAHAWVEHEGRPVGPDAWLRESFTPLERFGPGGAKGPI